MSVAVVSWPAKRKLLTWSTQLRIRALFGGRPDTASCIMDLDSEAPSMELMRALTIVVSLWSIILS